MRVILGDGDRGAIIPSLASPRERNLGSRSNDRKENIERISDIRVLVVGTGIDSTVGDPGSAWVEK